MGQLEDTLRYGVLVLEGQRLPYLLIGGRANLVGGEARTPQDIAITVQVEPASLSDVVSGLTQAFPALPENPVAFVKRTRVLPIVTANGIRADLVFAELPYQEEAIRRARLVTLGNTVVRVCSPEELVVHKRSSPSEQRTWTM